MEKTIENNNKEITKEQMERKIAQQKNPMQQQQRMTPEQALQFIDSVRMDDRLTFLNYRNMLAFTEALNILRSSIGKKE